MKKLHLGCGVPSLEGWENHDMDVDLRKPLPYSDHSIDFIFTEHCIEHLTQREAWDYFEECWRILKPAGVVRTTVPSIPKLYVHMTEGYLHFVQKNGWGDGTLKSGLKHVVFNHGHQSMWTPDLLITILRVLGFESYEAKLHESHFQELRNVEQHWKVVGREYSDMESITVEGIKHLSPDIT